MTNNFLPVSMPGLNGNGEEYIADAICSTWISSTGLYLRRFEREFSRICRVDYVITMSNSTVAPHLALWALETGSGDEVIVLSLTYIAAANAVRHAGTEPLFADVDENTWCLDPVKLESAILPRTSAIVVHFYSYLADMDSINQIARIHGLTGVEDVAEAFLAQYKGRLVGSLGRIATFSFYGNKAYCIAIGPGEYADISGHVQPGNGVLVGTRAQILQNLKINSDVTIGARAVVTHSTTCGLTVVGISAKPLSKYR